MQDKGLRKILENALSRLGFTVTYDCLEDGQGGRYRLKEKKEVVIDPRLSEPEKVGILTNALKGIDTSELYLPPVIRSLLGEDTTADGWE